MNTLQSDILAARRKKDILLMTHLVLGYPSLEVNRQVIEQMVENGVDLIELQIPFSEPVADGPVIARACQESIAAGTKVQECLELAAGVTRTFDVPFLFMTYCNIIFRHGMEDFIEESCSLGIRGLIVPDLPPEEGEDYLALLRKHGLASIQIFAPTSSQERMTELAAAGEGFVYCVARRGVTGARTRFDHSFEDYLARCRAATELPLAVGFGIRNRQDVEALKGQADIAVIGTRTIELVDEKGASSVGPFIASLR